MSQIKKKFLANDAVDQNKVKLDNNASLRARNAADSADLNLIKANASDKAQIDLELDMNGQAISNVGNVDGVDVSQLKSDYDAHVNGGASKHDATEIDFEKSDGSKKNIDAASDNVESAISDLDEAIGALDATPTNYTAADPTIVADHLAGIDAALAVVAGGDKYVKVSANDTTAGYVEDKFVVDNGSNSTNPLEASTLNDGGNEDYRIRFDQSKVDHGSIAGLADDDHTQYILVDGSRAFTGAQSMGGFAITNLLDPSSAQDAATKAYVDDKFVAEYVVDANAPAAGEGIRGENASSVDKFILGYGSAANIANSTGAYATSTDALVVMNTNDSGTGNNAQAALLLLTKQAATTLRSGKIFIRSGAGVGQTTGSTGSIVIESGYRDAASSSSGRTGNAFIGSGEDVGTGSGTTGNVGLYSGVKSHASSTGNTGTVSVDSGSHAGTGNSGNVSILSGNQTNSGNSGNITVQTGTVASGTRGSISISGNGITLDSDAGDVSVASNKIINLADGVAANDAVNKGQLDLKADADDVADLITLSGVAANSEDLGSFSGAIISDNETIKGALQDLETYIEALADPFFYAGTYNASTDSPALDNSDTGKNGFVYYVTVAGTQDFGAGNISFEVGDKVVNNGSTWDKWDMTDAVTSVNSQTGAVVLDTDDIAEGANLYFTDERAQDAVGNILIDSSTIDLTYNDGTPSITAAIVADSITNSHINSAAGIVDTKLATISTANKVSGSAVQLNASGALEDSSGLRVRVDAATIKRNASNNLEGLKPHSQIITLVAGDITNQYVDLSFAAYSAGAISLIPVDGLEQEQGVDYTVSLTGGAGGVTRLTFAGDLATGGAAELVATDKLIVKYSYLT